MAKVGRLTLLVFRKEFLISFAGTFFAILGVAATILTIGDWHLTVSYAASVSIFSLLASLAINWRRMIPPQMAIDGTLAFEAKDVILKTVNCPCDMGLARAATDLASKCFATTATISAESHEQLRVKNPFILACLTDVSGRLLGYFDTIPLRESFAVPFLRGSVTEEQITHEDVLSPEEMASCKYLFISGVVVSDPDSQLGKWSASVLVWSLLRYLDNFYSDAQPLVFAVAATKAGDALLSKFRFKQSGEAKSRADRYRLYSIQLTPQDISARLACIPDWTNLCSLSWNANVSRLKPGKKGQRPRLPATRVWNLDGNKAMANRRA